MTDKEREAILSALREQTKAHVANPIEARAFLLRSGVYTPQGNLTPEYGGETEKTASRAR